ncbi:hypothetical protein [Nocardia sp. NPDC050717]|uniref:DUF7373 family lipoprotein n=1 Tax=Nocardia sp. NPDC050717 TaxID=3157221 RepID=UPI0033E37DF7
MRITSNRLSAIAVAIAVTMLSAGCGATIAGSAVPGATSVDLDYLRPGPFKNEPTPFEFSWNPTTDPSKSIQLIEARRMLSHLLHPFDIDPELTIPGVTKIFADDISMPSTGGLGEEYRTPLRFNLNFIGGVSTSKSNGSVRSPKELAVAVLQFATDSESVRIADDFQRITLANGPRTAIEISGAIGIRASKDENNTVRLWVPHDKYLVWVKFDNSATDLEGAVATARRSVAQQIEMIDRFVPRPLDDVLNEPLDPTNIMRRAAIRDTRDSSGANYYFEDFGTFEPAGILHFVRNPVETRKKFEETGVDLIGRRASTVYRTRDLASAFQLQTFFARPGKNDIVLRPPAGIADAQCLRLDVEDASRKYDSLCAVVFDRYVAVVTANSISSGEIEGGLQERTAAQYAILKKCG